MTTGASRGLVLGAQRRGNPHRSEYLDGDCFAPLTLNRVAYDVTFTVMAGLVPAISRGTLPLRMAGTSPAMTLTAGFIQGGSASAGRWELAMTGTPDRLQDCAGAAGRYRHVAGVRRKSGHIGNDHVASLDDDQVLRAKFPERPHDVYPGQTYRVSNVGSSQREWAARGTGHAALKQPVISLDEEVADAFHGAHAPKHGQPFVSPTPIVQTCLQNAQGELRVAFEQSDELSAIKCAEACRGQSLDRIRARTEQYRGQGDRVAREKHVQDLAGTIPVPMITRCPAVEDCIEVSTEVTFANQVRACRDREIGSASCGRSNRDHAGALAGTSRFRRSAQSPAGCRGQAHPDRHRGLFHPAGRPIIQRYPHPVRRRAASSPGMRRFERFRPTTLGVRRDGSVRDHTV